MFERMPINQLLSQQGITIPDTGVDNQLNLFD